jgi:hypothetical protein
MLFLRWFKRPRKVEFLSLACAHLLPLPPLTRGAVCERVCTFCLMPLIHSFLELEEGVATRTQSTLATQEVRQ